jgi:hypothetical protein
MITFLKRITIFIFFAVPIAGFGQLQTLTGEVVAFNKFPIKNLKITAKKAKTEATTDENGKFEIQIKKKDVIKIDESVFVDYSKKVSGSDKNLRINLIIRNDEKNMKKVVKEGYISQEDLDYGVSNLWKWNNVFTQFTDAYDAIKYAIPEATIINENGQRGVQLRGQKSIHGSNAALIVVNGVITGDANFVTPGDIISIRKLEGGELALFGARAANGVISIETK